MRRHLVKVCLLGNYETLTAVALEKAKLDMVQCLRVV